MCFVVRWGIDKQRYVMKPKILIAAFGLVVLSTVTAFACSKHGQQAMSCAEGTAWDAEAATCVPLANS